MADGIWEFLSLRLAGADQKPKSRRSRSGPKSERVLGEPFPNPQFVTSFMDEDGKVEVGRVAEIFRMSKGQLAETVGLPTATLSKSGRRAGARAQGRMAEMLEIIGRIGEWTGGEAQAMAWYRSQPIPALNGRTAEALVKDGRAAAVRDYLDHLALGGYA